MATNDNDAHSVNQGKGPHEHESTMSRMLAMGASEMRNPTNVASPSRQKVDDHSIIIALQREMDTLKEKNAQEMNEILIQRSDVVPDVTTSRFRTRRLYLTV